MNEILRLSRRRFTAALAAVPATAALPELGDHASVFRIGSALTAQPFDVSRVRLGEGLFNEASAWNLGYLKSLDPDRLLHVFRVNAGLDSSAQPLGGWEAPKCELRGHFVGHYLSALALGFAATGDTSLKTRGAAMVKTLAACQAKLDQGGYLSAFPVEYFHRLEAEGKVWAPFYTLHKIMAGLIDLHAHASNREALDVVIGMAQWVDQWTAARTPARMQEILKVEFGGMSEVLYALAAATGDGRFAVTGDRFMKSEFLEPLARSEDRLSGLHANTHIPQVIGAARRYEFSADPQFRHMAEFFWGTVTGSRSYVSGGSSNREHWKAAPGQLSVEWREAAEHQECCCAYNMLKLTRHLFGWRPQAKYMDYYERVLVNHRLGTIQPQTGRSLYFLSMAPGAWKAPGLQTDTFWCCNGTAIEEFSKLGDTIYYRDAKGLWVNLFIASRLDWRERGIELTQQTRFPAEERTRLTVDRAPGDKWALRIRIPSWTTAPGILVNGKRVDASPGPSGYVTLVRRWKKGDSIELALPMSLRRESFADDPSLEAYLYGPVVLAGQFPKGAVPPDGDRMKAPDLVAAPYSVPSLRVRGLALESWLTPAAGTPMSWQTRGLDIDVQFKPLYQSWERYAVYWQTT